MKRITKLDLNEISLAPGGMVRDARARVVITPNGEALHWHPDAQPVAKGVTGSEPPMRKTKHVIKDFSLTEISMVDRPAQAGARMVLMKRDTGETKVSHGEPTARGVFNFLSKRKAPPQNDQPADTSADDGSNASDFEDLVGHLAAVHGSTTQAMQMARRKRPDLFAKFQRQGVEMQKAAADVAKANAVAQSQTKGAEQEFSAHIDAIAQRDRVPRHVAASRARVQHPSVFKAAFGGN